MSNVNSAGGTTGQTPMAPGDEAPLGAPGTGQDICRKCAGTGEFGDRPCDDCAGTGWVNVGIGGG